MNRLVTENCQYGFPGNKKYLDFIQDEQITQYVQNLIAGVFGSNPTGILSGCDVNSDTVSSGVVLISGELLQFEGGVKKNYIAVQESVEQVFFQDGSAHDAYKRRNVKFSDTNTNGAISWYTLDSNRINIQTILADCVKKVKPSGGHKYLSFDNAYAGTTGGSNLLCQWDDTCWVNLRGSVLLKQQTVALGSWYEVCDLNTADGSGKKLIPSFPNNSKDVYFEGYRAGESYYQKILFRITGDGKWEVFADSDSVFGSSARVNINAGFANPPKLL